MPDTLTAIPSSSDELKDLLSDQEKVRKIQDEGRFSDLIQAYVKAVTEKDKTIERQVREETQRVLAQMLKDNPDLAAGPLPRPDVTPDRIGHKPNANAIGAPLNGLFKTKGEFFNAVWHNTHPRGMPTPEQVEAVGKIKAYQEKVPAEGGFLVPEEWRAEILRLSLESAIVRPRARVIPMANPTLHFPAIDETSRASSVFGGVVVYRTEEGADLVESSASFKAIKLEASKQTALAHVTNELLRDVAAFESFIEETFPPAMAWFEDLDFISGAGAGVPLGGLHPNNLALITVLKASGQDATTLVWENIIAMYARMLPGSIDRAVWLASPDTFAQLATMALTVGTGGSAVWIMDATQRPRLTLLGAPVIMTEKAPAALGTKGDLSFVDWSYYLIGDRQTMTVDSSPHVKFVSDKTTFRAIARNDGRPWLENPITPHNGSATLSPFVQLETRS